MIHRRAFVVSAAATTLLPSFARAAASRLSLSGSQEQGGLVVMKAAPGALANVDRKNVLVSPEGLFAFGIAYDRTDGATVRVDFADGISETRVITPIVRHYEVQTITGLPQKFVTPPPEDIARIKAEHARLAVARQIDSPETWFSEPFDWPFSGIISGVYGSQRILNGTPMAPHLGVDLAAPEGTPIHAPADARVAIAAPWFLEGNFTMLDHGHGVFTEYLHQSAFKVKEGDVVARGQMIGLVGQTGRATGPHTHWGMNWFELKLDPSLYTRTPAPAKS
ncbi:MAG TPA: M23 family metallopeptidase [Rhizomicrobium sp.]|jgi:murein DD-endopeptidase MepM/ murein hydrolase activator NlpD